MKRSICIVVLALTVTSIAPGYSAKSDPAGDRLKATLQERLGDATIKSISKSPIAGLYEVNVGTHIIYSDATGDYLVLGDMVDA